MAKRVKKAKKATRPIQLTEVPTTLKQMLSVLDQFLLRANRPAADLWNVLTALRGPDTLEEHLKEAYTIPIRHAAFPRCRRSTSIAVSGKWPGRHYPGGLHAGQTQKAFSLAVVPSKIYHFGKHALSAAQALKLVK